MQIDVETQKPVQPVKKTSKILTFLNPPSTSETGVPRLISIEFLRGFAIFAMVIGHQAAMSLSLSDRTAGGINTILFYVLVTPIGVLAGYRSFFVLISGIAVGYAFFARITHPNFKGFAVSIGMQFIGSVLLIPLYYIYHVLETISYTSAFGSINISQPFYDNIDTVSQAPIFFGLSIPMNLVFLFLQYCCFGFPMHNKLKLEQILAILAGFNFFIALLGFFCFSSFSQILRSFILNTYAFGDLKPEDVPVECPANFTLFADNFQKHLTDILLHFLCGKIMQVNGLYSFYFVGFGYACIMVRFKVLKQKCQQEEDDVAYQKLRKQHIIIFWCLTVAAAVLAGLCILQAHFELKSGKRSYNFNMQEFLQNQQPIDWCGVPEYTAPLLFTQTLFLNLAFHLFEFSSKAKIYIRTQRILFLRRFSTLSFTYFVFSRYLGNPLYNILGVFTPKSQSCLEFYGFLVLYFIITLLIQLVLDSAQCKLMPDWILKKFMNWFSIGNKGANQRELSESHMNVKPVCLFSKELNID